MVILGNVAVGDGINVGVLLGISVGEAVAVAVGVAVVVAVAVDARVGTIAPLRACVSSVPPHAVSTKIIKMMMIDNLDNNKRKTNSLRAI